MARTVLSDPDKIHPSIVEVIDDYHRDLIAEVEHAIERHPVVVVGMAQNPHPKKARKLLEQRGIAFEYLEYGSYLSMWRRRLALKMWAGWPTFPMIFIKGVFIGGADNLRQLARTGELDRLLE